MGYPGGFAPGPPGAAAAGPPADAVAVVAQRLAGVAQELDALRLMTAQLDGVDWHSAAAEEFRKSLADLDFRFSSASRQIGTAVDLLGSYAAYLRSAADPVIGGDVCWRVNPGVGPFLGNSPFGAPAF
jgi:hypothetical protein